MAKNRFAVVLTSTDGLRENLTAIFNGIELYGSQVDVHLLASGISKVFLDRLPERYTVVPWEDIQDNDRPVRKKSGWEVRFYRYRYIPRIADQYDAVMILDADSFVVNDLTPLFERSAREQVMIAPRNLRGVDINRATLGSIKGAASPSFHCTPFVFPPKLHEWLIPEMYQWGYDEDNGDMATLFRTLLRHEEHKNVEMTPNELFVNTNWFYEKVRVEEKYGLKELYHKEDRVSIVHGRWAMNRYYDRYLMEPKNQPAGQWYDIGKYNADIYQSTIRWLNQTGPIDWKANSDEKEGAA